MGHIISDHGVQIDPDKVKSIRNMEAPKNIKQLRSFLGMINYLSRFIHNLSNEATELRYLEKKGIQWNWTSKHDESFQNLKNIIANVNTLKYFDPSTDIKIQCDASDYGLGAVLLQEDQPVQYASRTLNSTEKKYAPIEKEALGILFAVQKFH